MSIPIDQQTPMLLDDEPTAGDRLRRIPWWLVALVLVIAVLAWQIVVDPQYRAAYDAIIPGIRLTVTTTIVSFLLSMVVGLLAGLGRISRNPLFRNLATAYIEFVRGVPVLVLILTVAFVVVPAILSTSLMESLGFTTRSVSASVRGIIALTIIYGAFLAEVFRAGIESVPRGQSEAARSVGMTQFQAMRYIILPQAIRNILPALGNDLIAILKDSSLVSILAVREITQQARIYTASTFLYTEGYLVLTVLYLIMTMVLSLLLQWYQRRVRSDDH